jgi:hypothetical protein
MTPVVLARPLPALLVLPLAAAFPAAPVLPVVPLLSQEAKAAPVARTAQHRASRLPGRRRYKVIGSLPEGQLCGDT